MKRYHTILPIILSVLMISSLTAQKKNQVKRIHQHSLDKIEAGNTKAAIEYLKKVEAKIPSQNAETQFMLCAAFAAQNKLDDAVKHMNRAIELGLPKQRFLAGPKKLFQPLENHIAYQKLLKQYTDQLIHGPLIGEVTDNSARIWVRTAKPKNLQVEVSTSANFSSHQTTNGATTAKNDNTAVIHVKNLKPDTAYFYRLKVADAKKQITSKSYHFKTSPPTAEKTKFTLAFGGGAGFVPDNERMWNTIDSFSPQMMLLLGDNVYSDHPKSTMMQQYCYYRRQSRSEFRNLFAHTPVYSIWDDHDFGTNDCFGGPQIEKPAWKRDVWNTFKQNWANPAYGGGKSQPGCWYHFTYGDVEFFMLDGRYYRTNPKLKNGSMLGPVQLAWLKKRLTQSKATFKVICSPVPWEYRTKGNSKDTWNGYRQEREVIFSHLEQNKIQGVVLFSADRHRSDAWQIKRTAGYDLYEFNSSRLTNQHIHPTMKQAIFSYNKKPSFGLVTLNTKQKDPTVTYRVIDIDGKQQHSITVQLSQLRYRKE